MNSMFFRLGRTAACLLLAGTLLTSCSLLPAASPRKDPAPAEQTLYDSAPLEDGQLRILYSSNSPVVLCGGTVLHEGRSDENLSLLTDSLTGETSYYWRSWADTTLPSGRRSALYDKSGTALQTFEQDYTASLTGNYLVLSGIRSLEFDSNAAVQPGDCRVLDLSTGEKLPIPDRAYQCAIVGDTFAFTCYDRPETLPDGDYDEALYQHTRMRLQDRAGNVLREETHCTASSFSAGGADLYPTDWLALDFYGESPEDSITSVLYNPSTGEELSGFDQFCGNGTACFQTENGTYQLMDLVSGEHSEVLSEFDRSISYYVPGAAIAWENAGADYRYRFYDLSTGDTQPLYGVDSSDTELALYALDGTLRVYDRTSGAILTDVTADPLEDQDSVQIWAVGDGYVLLMLYPTDPSALPTIRLYNSNGLVRELELPASDGNSSYYFAPLLTAGGHAYFRYGYDGPNRTTLYDVLDETGTVVLKGLATCYSYYSTSSNALPEGAFVARKGFYEGWMDLSGQWLYCHSLFSSPADENGLSDFF